MFFLLSSFFLLFFLAGIVHGTVHTAPEHPKFSLFSFFLTTPPQILSNSSPPQPQSRKVPQFFLYHYSFTKTIKSFCVNQIYLKPIWEEISYNQIISSSDTNEPLAPHLKKCQNPQMRDFTSLQIWHKGSFHRILQKDVNGLLWWKFYWLHNC